jgi:hypothetical protein
LRHVQFIPADVVDRILPEAPPEVAGFVEAHHDGPTRFPMGVVRRATLDAEMHEFPSMEFNPKTLIRIGVFLVRPNFTRRGVSGDYCELVRPTGRLNLDFKPGFQVSGVHRVTFIGNRTAADSFGKPVCGLFTHHSGEYFEGSRT